MRKYGEFIKYDHRTFLRAGCARVVLTIRPGFECSFAQLVEHFTLQTDPSQDPGACVEALGDHPYVSIGDEIRNYAMTNYEHLPPANPDRNVRPLLYPLQQRAWADMQKIIAAPDQYDRDQHTADPNLDPNVHIYPDKLKLLPNATSFNLKDPWGRDFVYKFPNEYTPTAALDVAINLTLPTTPEPA